VPVVGVPAADLASRENYFRQMIEMELASPALREANLTYHAAMPNILAHCYFAVSEAYKKIYLRDGHRTDLPKRAALMCATIVAVGPIRTVPGANDPELAAEAAYANPMLAMRISSSIIKHPFHKRPFDDRRRVYRAFFSFKLPSIDPILEEARTNNGAIPTDWQISLSAAEESLLNLLVDDFVVYSKLVTAEQENR
jgi:hypothetical protein